MDAPTSWEDPRLLALLGQLCDAARLNRKVLAREDADDLRSEVAARLVSAGPLAGSPPLAAWEAYLRQVVDHAVIDRHRRHVEAEKRTVNKEKREADLSPGHSPDSTPQLAGVLAGNDTTPSQRAAKNEDLERLEAAIGRLPKDQQQVIRLHLQGLGPSAIAGQIGRTPDAVSSLIRRATQRLTDELR